MMHFTVVKIDKSLIDFIGEKNGDLILNYAMALGKELGVKLVAEGVETVKQLCFLREHNCDFIQGYYFSKPLPQEEFEATEELADNARKNVNYFKIVYKKVIKLDFLY